MILSIFPIQGWSQNISKNKEIIALRKCDSLYTNTLQDLEVCNYSDSISRKLLKDYKQLKNKDSLIIINLRSQIDVKNKQIVNKQLKPKQKNTLLILLGITLGYFIKNN